MKKIAGFLCLFIEIAFFTGCGKQPVTLLVLETTDLHGAFLNDFSAGCGYIRGRQKEYRDRLLLFDCGDNLQGTPGIYYANFVDTLNPHIFASYANWAGYNVIAVGNHDVEVGHKVYDRVYSAVNMPVLCANAIDIRTQKPYFEPYTITQKKGYKIAVLGLLDPEAVNWITPEDLGNLSFISMRQAAEYWVKRIQDIEKPDIIIGLFHVGFEGCKEIARTVPGIDLICYGHDHSPAIHQVVSINGEVVELISSGSKGSYIAQSTMVLTSHLMHKGTEVEIKSELIHVADIPEYQEPDPLRDSFLSRMQDYMNRPICELKATVYSKEALQGSSAWMDEHHSAIFEIVEQYVPELGVDVSFTSLAYRNQRLQKGILTVRDFISFYPYENKLVLMKMTGDEIIRYLEYAYMLRLEYPTGPAYNFDSAAGLIYFVHRDRPYGQRVEIVSMADGSPFDLDAEYNVAMTDFRARGGGGHVIRALNWTKEDISNKLLWESNRDVRQLFMQRATLRSPITFKKLNQWQYL